MLKRVDILKRLKRISDDYLSFFLQMKSECDRLNDDLCNNMDKEESLTEKIHRDIFNSSANVDDIVLNVLKNKDSIICELAAFNLYFNEYKFSVQMDNANTVNSIVVNKLKYACDHEIVEDDIDIDVERTQRIRYCIKCECTFDIESDINIDINVESDININVKSTI